MLGEEVSAREMPPPSPELMLLSALVAVYIRRLPRKERLGFLSDVTKELEWQTANSKIVRLRPKSDDSAVDIARAKANVWWHRAAGLFLAHVR